MAASSSAAAFLSPKAASFLGGAPESKSSNSPFLLRWNPFLFRGSLLTKSPFFPVLVRAKSARMRPHSSFFDAVEVAEEEESLQQQSPSLGNGGGLLCSVLEALGAPKGSATAAVLLGLFFAAASPCAAISVVASSTQFASIRPEAGFDNPCLSLLMMGSAAAVTTLARCFPDDPNREMSKTLSLPRDLDQIAENTETSFLEELSSVRTAVDYIASQNYFRNKVEAPRVSYLKGRNLGIKWNNQICMPRKVNLQGHCDSRRRHIVMAVASSTQQCLAPSEFDTKLLLGSDLGVQKVQAQTSNDETPEIDDREKLRRMRISKANKGNVPWNLGRKHSAETLQRIREGTRLAMQDPKVKMKLMNLGHAQSEEARIKIGIGVREGWRRRQEKRLLQEGCLFEWQNNIAEFARKGCVGENELQWDSYKTLNEQLKHEWLESIEIRKNMARPKGSRRAPKSLEQRRKISEAISAKWTDEEYRARVCTGLFKYHGTAVGVERKRRKSSREKPVRDVEKKEAIKSVKNLISKRRRNSTPLFKDPMASFKLEIIKKIREKRAAKEVREAAERAKLLIAEAEKAAKALEMAALKSPLAQASLLETRKLIAEATRSIENIEIGTSRTQDFEVNKSLDSDGPLNDPQGGAGVLGTEKFNGKHVNGFHLLPSSETNHKDLGFDKLSLPATVNGWEPSTTIRSIEKPAELGLPLNTKGMGEGLERMDNATSEAVINRSSKYEDNTGKEDTGMSEVKTSVSSMSMLVKPQKKWVRGRLIEVDESDVAEEGSKQENK